MNVITVSQVNTYIKALLDESQPLRNIYIIGEISNFKHYISSGHLYFTLKDEASQLRGVMYANKAKLLKFKPENGMKVICRGNVSVFERNGEYQLYVDDMQPDGLGALNLAFEQLKRKLFEEGLFDEKYKKPIPRFPKKIGVATSNMGAAIEDIKNITKRRYPACELVIKPTIVQGASSAQSIVNSIEALEAIDDIDLIIVGRGGGSIEDLWGFNTEEVARAIFKCRKPIISAVGHETDTTISDFVADLRAPTPSAAAELAVPNMVEVIAYFDNANQRMKTALNSRLDFEKNRLQTLEATSVMSNPSVLLEASWLEFEKIKNQLELLFNNSVEAKKAKLSVYAEKLNALSPLAVLGRGYAVIQNNNSVVKSVNDLSQGEKIKLTISDGTASCTVDEVKYE